MSIFYRSNGLKSLVVLTALFLSGCGLDKSFVHTVPPIKAFKPSMAVTKDYSVSALGGYGSVGHSFFAMGASGQAYHLAPALTDHLLVAVSDMGLVTAMDPSTGRVLWKQSYHVGFGISPVIGRDAIFVATHAGSLMAIDRRTGRQQWSVDLHAGVLAKAALSDDKVIVRTTDDTVYALSTQDGHVLWQYGHDESEVIMHANSSPVIYGPYVLVGLSHGQMVVLRLSDGGLIASHPLFSPQGDTPLERMVDIVSSPIMKGSTVYAASLHGGIKALDLKAGDLLWHADSNTVHTMASDSKALYVVTPDADVLAYDLQSGHMLWKQAALHGRQLSAPVVVGKAVVVAGADGVATWLSVKDGSLMVRAQVANGSVTADPVTDGKAVYFYSVQGGITKFS